MRNTTLAALGFLLLAACGDASRKSEEAVDYTQAAPAAAPAPIPSAEQSQRVASGVESGAAPRPDAPGEDLPASAAQADSAATPTMLIRNGEATLQVDSLEPAVARVRRLAAAAGGFVANTSMSSGENEARKASLEIRVPAARFDPLVGGLRPLGKVESVNVTAEDVGEEFVDVNARVANARRLEARLVELLATRTGKLEDVLAVERELARVREEIDRYEGRIRYLRSHVAMSTLTVNLHEPVPVVGGDPPGTNPIAEAFRDAWRNFVGFLAGFIASLGFLLPLGLLAWIAWRLFRRVRRPRGDRGPSPLGIHRPEPGPLRDGTTDAGA